MARKKNVSTQTPLRNEESSVAPRAFAWDDDDEEAQIRFSLTALGEAVVNDRDRRRPKFPV